MLLSIAMIVKNEEKKIVKSLEAIKQLDGYIDYEIIIVDTGSDDDTVKIVKQYTEKVYIHEWNGNFADMRNISISHCRGEWILILDADEILENKEMLIKVLKDKESSKVNSVSLRIKNLDNDGRVLAELSLLRLFRRTNEFKYIGRIHEQPLWQNPLKHSNIVLMHDGYTNDNYKKIISKSKRNRELLLKDLEDGVNKLYTLYQLGQNYGFEDKILKSTEYLKEAYRLIKKDGIEEKYLYIIHLYAKNLMNLGQYKKVIMLASEGLKYEPSNIDFNFMMAFSKLYLYENEESIKYFDKYLKIQGQYEVGEKIPFTLMSVYTVDRKKEAIRGWCEANLRKKKYKEIIEKTLKEKVSIKKHIYRYFIESCIRTRNIKDLKAYLEIINISEKMVDELNEIINNMILEEGEKSICLLVKELTGFNRDVDKVIKVILKENIDIGEYDLKRYSKLNLEAIKLALKENINILDELISIGREEVEEYINGIVSDIENMTIVISYIDSNFITDDINKLLLKISIEEALLNCGNIEKKEYEEILYKTIRDKYCYIKMVYSEQIYKGNYKLIPVRNDRFYCELIYCLGMLHNNYLEGILKIKQLLEIYNEKHAIINVFIDSLDKNITVNKDMILELDIVLTNLEFMIDENGIERGENIIDELLKTFKYHSKLYNLKGVLEYVKGNTIEAEKSFYKSIVFDIENQESEECLKIISGSKSL